MATELSEQLTRLGHKAELLVTRYATLQDADRRLRDELLEAKAQLTAANATIEKLQVENEYLRISSALAPDTASAIRARATLSDLVREIDACVADLMKDI